MQYATIATTPSPNAHSARRADPSNGHNTDRLYTQLARTILIRGFQSPWRQRLHRHRVVGIKLVQWTQWPRLGSVSLTNMQWLPLSRRMTMTRRTVLKHGRVENVFNRWRKSWRCCRGRVGCGCAVVVCAVWLCGYRGSLSEQTRGQEQTQTSFVVGSSRCCFIGRNSKRRFSCQCFMIPPSFIGCCSNGKAMSKHGQRGQRRRLRYMYSTSNTGSRQRCITKRMFRCHCGNPSVAKGFIAVGHGIVGR
jgi:hypothetical protein